MFLRFSSLRIISLIPARLAARIFSLIPPTGRTFSAQRDFACHGKIGLYFSLRKCGCQRSSHCYTCRRAIFGDSSFGNMNMDIPIVENLFIKIQQRSMRLDILQCQHSRFFHYITQVSGQCQATAFTAAETGFDKQNLTADSSPCQARNYTGIFIALIFVACIFGSTQELHKSPGLISVFAK